VVSAGHRDKVDHIRASVSLETPAYPNFKLMGLIRMGPPEALVLELKTALGINTFVETGTYRGTTAEWASNHFDRVYSIEQSDGLYLAAKNVLGHVRNVELIHSSSPEGLKSVKETSHKACVYWLDAHWSGAGTAGSDNQCPLLEELQALTPCDQSSVLLIDDARLFLSTPQPPHDPDQWPTISQIVKALDACLIGNFTAVVEDVIVCVPTRAMPILRAYCQQASEKVWQKYVVDKQSEMQPHAKTTCLDRLRYIVGSVLK